VIGFVFSSHFGTMKLVLSDHDSQHSITNSSAEKYLNKVNSYTARHIPDVVTLNEILRALGIANSRLHRRQSCDCVYRSLTVGTNTGRYASCHFKLAHEKYELLHVGVAGAAVAVAPAKRDADDAATYWKSVTPGSWEQNPLKMDVATAISGSLLEHSVITADRISGSAMLPCSQTHIQSPQPA